MARSSLLSLLVASALPLLAIEPVEARLQKGWQTVSAESAMATVKTLASPTYGGRMTGQPTYTAAAQWAASQFKAWGLKPIDAKEGYLQPYPAPHSVVDQAILEIITPKERINAQVLADFLPMLFSDSGHAKGGTAFVGWGIHAPELGYDDYAGLDVKGKFVLCFRGTPERDPKWVEHDEHRTRMRVAHAKGALGLIYIYPEVLANPNGDRIAGFLPAMISEAMASRILAEKNLTATELKQRLRDTKRPASLELGTVLDLTVKTRYFPKALGYNIAGYVEGTDPALKQECVVLGAHFDSEGEHLGILFPGADDNASGSAVVMEAARAMARNGDRPKRSVLFVLFGSEEQGSQGSAQFMAHLPSPFSKVTAMLNFDMEGVGTKASISLTPALEPTKPLLQKADAAGIVANIGTTRSVGNRSGDIVPFFLKGVPIGSFYSNGERPLHSYHLPGDNPTIIQPKIMEDIARLAFRYSFYLADQ